MDRGLGPMLNNKQWSYGFETSSMGEFEKSFFWNA